MTNPLARFAACALLIMAGQLAGCANVAHRDAEVYDPLEPMNRAIFRANMAVDRAVIKPVAKGYRALLPQYPRDRFRAFVNNLLEPRIFINDLLQMRLNSAGMTFARFLMNSTFGVLGFWDRAVEHNLPRQTGDFGQTLYMWGVGDGPYLVLPFFGPSNVRDATGFAVDLYTDVYANPVRYIVSDEDRSAVTIGIGVLDGIDLRSRNIESLDLLESNAIDFYSLLRSISQQHRHSELRKARGLEDEPAQLLDPDAPDEGSPQ